MNKSLFSKNYILVVSAAALFYIASFMLNSVSGRYSLEIGADKTVSGIVTSAFTLSSFFTRCMWGYITDKKGRKAVFITGGILCLISGVLLIFTKNVWLLFAARAVFGGGYSAFTTAGGTIVCDISGEEQIGKAISFYGITNVLSQAAAPAVALWLFDFGFIWVAAAVCGLVSLAVLGGIFIKYDESEYINQNLKFKIYEKTAMPAAFVIFFFAMATASVYSFVPIMARERQLSGEGFFFALSAAGLLFSRIFNTKFCEKFGKNKVYYIGNILFMAGFAMLGFSYSTAFLLVCAAVYGTGAGFVHPVVNTAAVQYCKPEKRGLATGTFMMSQDLGMTIGALLWGIISENIGFTAVYITVAASAAVMMAVFKKLLSEKLSKN